MLHSNVGGAWAGWAAGASDERAAPAAESLMFAAARTVVSPATIIASFNSAGWPWRVEFPKIRPGAARRLFTSRSPSLSERLAGPLKLMLGPHV
jgi:hypothetical protein